MEKGSLSSTFALYISIHLQRKVAIQHIRNQTYIYLFEAYLFIDKLSVVSCGVAGQMSRIIKQ